MVCCACYLFGKMSTQNDMIMSKVVIFLSPDYFGKEFTRLRNREATPVSSISYHSVFTRLPFLFFSIISNMIPYSPPPPPPWTPTLKARIAYWIHRIHNGTHEKKVNPWFVSKKNGCKLPINFEVYITVLIITEWTFPVRTDVIYDNFHLVKYNCMPTSFLSEIERA